MSSELTQFNQIVFGMKKQSALGTSLLDADIDYSVDLKSPCFPNIAPEFQTNEEAINSREFATSQLMTAKNTGLALELDWDSKLAGLLLTLLLQDVQSTQPDAPNDPDAWEHVIKPSALSGGAGNLFTTVILAQTSDIKDKLPDMVVSEVRFVVDRNLLVTGGATLVGSGLMEEPGGPYEYPTVEDGSYLYSNQGNIEIDSTPIITTFRGLECRVFQEILMNDFEITTTAADRGIRDRLDFGKRGIELSAELIVDGGATERAKLLAGTSMSFEWESLGELITVGDALRHGIKLVVPKAYYSAYELEDQDGRIMVKVTFQVVDDKTTGYPFQFTVRNKEAWYLAAP